MIAVRRAFCFAEFIWCSCDGWPPPCFSPPAGIAKKSLLMNVFILVRGLDRLLSPYCVADLLDAAAFCTRER